MSITQIQNKKIMKGSMWYWSFGWYGPPCKNYTNVRFKLMFIWVLALVAMHSTYIGQLVRASAAPLILHMHAYLGVVAYT